MPQIDNIHYIHLRCHSEFSVTDGIVRISDYTEKAKKIGTCAEAVVVGSAFVNKISENLYEDGTPKDCCVESVLNLVRDISGGLTNSTKSSN